MKQDTQQPAEGGEESKDAKRKGLRRRLRRAAIWGVFLGLCFVCFSISPLWRLLWYLPVYSRGNWAPVKDVHGRPHEAWRWVEGRSIRVYQLPGLPKGTDETIAKGVRELLRDVGLDLTVEVRPIPKEIVAACEASLVSLEADGQPRRAVSMKALASRLVPLRDGDPHADVLAVDVPIAETEWAFGMAGFNRGLVLIGMGGRNEHTAKHEAAHLMGYMMHDSWPLFVFGYPWEGWPSDRNTLMMLLSTNSDLSPRARDAIRSFWRRIEYKTGGKYLSTTAEDAESAENGEKAGDF